MRQPLRAPTASLAFLIACGYLCRHVLRLENVAPFNAGLVWVRTSPRRDLSLFRSLLSPPDPGSPSHDRLLHERRPGETSQSSDVLRRQPGQPPRRDDGVHVVAAVVEARSNASLCVGLKSESCPVTGRRCKTSPGGDIAVRVMLLPVTGSEKSHTPAEQRTSPVFPNSAVTRLGIRHVRTSFRFQSIGPGVLSHESRPTVYRWPARCHCSASGLSGRVFGPSPVGSPYATI